MAACTPRLTADAALDAFLAQRLGHRFAGARQGGRFRQRDRESPQTPGDLEDLQPVAESSTKVVVGLAAVCSGAR
jgi:hypothetical protein